MMKDFCWVTNHFEYKTIQGHSLQLGAERENEFSHTHTLFSGQWDISQSNLEQANLSSLFMSPEEMRGEWIPDRLLIPVRALHAQLENQANISYFFITSSYFWE